MRNDMKSLQNYQILLLKILHEFNNSPDFGEEYISNANSKPQQWIARIGALFSQFDIIYEASFEIIKNNTKQHWSESREDFRRELLSASEKIKLHLELEGQENIGTVYNTNQEYDFMRDLKEIISEAKNEIFIIDPYFDGDSFNTYLGDLGNKFTIRILYKKESLDVVGHIKRFESQYKVKSEIRKSNEIHDRIIILDKTDCWIIGGSIKDAGIKPTYLIPLSLCITPEKIKIYENIWKNATPK